MSLVKQLFHVKLLTLLLSIILVSITFVNLVEGSSGPVRNVKIIKLSGEIEYSSDRKKWFGVGTSQTFNVKGYFRAKPPSSKTKRASQWVTFYCPDPGLEKTLSLTGEAEKIENSSTPPDTNRCPEKISSLESPRKVK